MGISPDGKTSAYLVEVLTSEQQSGIEKVALLDLATLNSPQLMDVNLRISSGAQFTTDGKALAYCVRENGVDNIWIQPIDGSPGRRDPRNSMQSRSSRFTGRRMARVLGILRGANRFRRRPSARIQTLDFPFTLVV